MNCSNWLMSMKLTGLRTCPITCKRLCVTVTWLFYASKPLRAEQCLPRCITCYKYMINEWCCSLIGFKSRCRKRKWILSLSFLVTHQWNLCFPTTLGCTDQEVLVLTAREGGEENRMEKDTSMVMLIWEMRPLAISSILMTENQKADKRVLNSLQGWIQNNLGKSRLSL